MIVVEITDGERTTEFVPILRLIGKTLESLPDGHPRGRIQTADVPVRHDDTATVLFAVRVEWGAHREIDGVLVPEDGETIAL